MTHVAGEIGVVEAFRFDHADPEHAARVRRARHAGLFAQFDETFRLDLERQPPAIRAERAQHREHLARDAPDEVDFHFIERVAPGQRAHRSSRSTSRMPVSRSLIPLSRRAAARARCNPNSSARNQRRAQRVEGLRYWTAALSHTRSSGQTF
jgi:hypothetical protein